MPWHVGRSDSCPASKPWAAIADETGDVMGCHASEEAAQAQVDALYANEPTSGGYQEGKTMAATTVERRFTLLPVELRSGGARPKIGGYAAIFNSISQNLGGFVEAVKPGFFNRSHSLGWPDVMARYNHDDNQLLGTTAAGTLTLSIDDVGLSYDVEPPRSAGYVMELVQRGDVRKSSFAFIAEQDDWAMSEDQNYPMRHLLNGRLVDVAPVNSPAYTSTTAGLRSMDPAVVQRLSLGPEAAYASLALRMSATVEDVRELAQSNELRKFFVRTDGPGGKPKPRAFAPQAAAALLARRADPWE